MLRHGQGRGDRNPSLSLRDSHEGKLLVKCHAGCSHVEVFHELERRDLLQYLHADRTRSVDKAAFSAIASKREPPRADPINASRIAKARWLWSKRRPIDLSDAEQYLIGRGLKNGAWPATIGYLPSLGDHPHCLICAFGIATEAEPGSMTIVGDAVVAVHLIKLGDGGHGKLDVRPNKITIGRPLGSPIVCAPMNDLLGLAVCEGPEDALSIHKATGVGAWASASASLMPALADAVPFYVDSVSIIGHRDRAGTKGARELEARLQVRGISCRVTSLEKRGDT